VKAETNISEAKSGGWWWNNNTSSSDYSIDYEIFMPTANKLNLTNKYGATSIARLENDVTVEQRYGNLNMEGASTAIINIGYGNAWVNRCAKFNAFVEYGKLHLDEAQELQLKTKYSHIEIVKVEHMSNISAYDDYNIASVNQLSTHARYGDITLGKVDDLKADLSYTDMKIKHIANGAAFTSSYGNVKIDNISSGFTNISIDGSYTGYAIGIEPGANYQLDIACTYSGLVRPAVVKYSLDKENGSSKELMGYVGNSNAKSLIRARLSYGGLTIK